MPRGIRNNSTVQPTEKDYAYAAGLIDGDGCISIRESGQTSNTRWNPSWYASVVVAMTHPGPLRWLQERWGGSIRQVRQRGERERPSWEWLIVNRQCYQLLEGLEPKLKCKERQAHLALQLRDLRKPPGSGHVLTAADLKRRQDIRDGVRRLNSSREVWSELPETALMQEQQASDDEGDDGKAVLF